MHALDGGGVADQPDQRHQAEVEAEHHQHREGWMPTSKLRQQAGEERDHLGVGEVAHQSLPECRRGGKRRPLNRFLELLARRPERAAKRAKAQVDQVGRAGQPDGEKQRLGCRQERSQAGAGRDGPDGLTGSHAGGGSKAGAGPTRQRVADRQRGVLTGCADDEKGHRDKRDVSAECQVRRHGRAAG